MNTYENNNKKAAEYKSSAIALMIVGILGLIFVGLVFFNVIPINMVPSWKAIACAFMCLFCLFLIITGISSIKTVKSLLTLAKEEDTVTAEVEKWYKEELSKDKIENFIIEHNPEYIKLSESEKYFHRCDVIKFALTKKFMNLNVSFVDNMIEKIYQDLFE